MACSPDTHLSGEFLQILPGGGRLLVEVVYQLCSEVLVRAEDVVDRAFEEICLREELAIALHTAITGELENRQRVGVRDTSTDACRLDTHSWMGLQDADGHIALCRLAERCLHLGESLGICSEEGGNLGPPATPSLVFAADSRSACSRARSSSPWSGNRLHQFLGLGADLPTILCTFASFNEIYSALCFAAGCRRRGRALAWLARGESSDIRLRDHRTVRRLDISLQTRHRTAGVETGRHSRGSCSVCRDGGCSCLFLRQCLLQLSSCCALVSGESSHHSAELSLSCL